MILLINMLQALKIQLLFNAASDDFNAGGGNATDGIGIQSFSNYSIDSYKIPQSYWNNYFQE